MSIVKYFEDRLNISAVEAQDKNIDSMLLRKLNNKFKGRCHKGSYITDVTDIVKRSKLEVQKSLQDGAYSVSVFYKAKCVIIDKGTILANNIVEKNMSNIAFLKNNDMHCNISVSINATNRGLTKGFIVPVKIIAVDYTEQSTEINCNGDIFLYNKSAIIYKVTGDVGEESKKYFERIGEFTTPDKKSLQISELFYINSISWNDWKKNLQSGIKIIPIEHIKPNTIVCRHPYIEKTQNAVLEISEAAFKKLEGDMWSTKFMEIKTIELPYNLVIADIINDYYNYNQFIKDISEVLTPSTIEKQKSLWDIYHRNRL